MDQQLEVSDKAKKMLGGKGKKLITHEMNLKRLEGGKTLARHQLADKHGNPPQDGQKATKEYALNPEELGAHVEQHMAPMQDGDEDDEAQ